MKALYRVPPDDPVVSAFIPLSTDVIACHGIPASNVYAENPPKSSGKPGALHLPDSPAPSVQARKNWSLSLGTYNPVGLAALGRHLPRLAAMVAVGTTREALKEALYIQVKSEFSSGIISPGIRLFSTCSTEKAIASLVWESPMRLRSMRSDSSCGELQSPCQPALPVPDVHPRTRKQD